MITPSFGLTATERVLPKLALDFTTASLDPRVTVTRTTGASNPATYINGSGAVTTATNNQPRFDYNPMTLVCKGLLIEESRTNNQKQSSTFSDAVWTKAGTTVANGVVSPDQSTIAEKIVEDTSTGTHRVFTNVGIVTLAATDYTISVFAKSAGRNLQLRNNNLSGADFDLINGTVSGTGLIEAYPDGWYRCTITRQPGTTDRVVVYLLNGSSNSYAGDGSSGIYLWGAQHEPGAFATSHIPTTTTSLTRNADVVTMTGTNFSDWFNASEGALSVKYLKATTNTAGRYIVRLFSPTVGAGVSVWSNTNGIDTRYWIGATNATIGNGSLSAPNVAALAYKTAASTGALNGAANASNAGTVPSDINELRIGDGGFMNGHMQRILYWPFALTAAEIRANSKG